MAASNPLAELLALSAAPSSSKGGFLGEAAHVVSHGLGNLGSDLLHTATGLPGGIEQLATHPVRSVEAMGKSTWHDWSPLFEGHVGKFLHQTYDHPLAPLLDVATVFTGGAGAAAKLGSKAAELGLIDKGSAIAKLGKADKIDFTRPEHFTEKQPGLPVESKTTSANPVVRLRQHMVHNTITSLDGHLPQWFTDHVAGNAASYQRITLGKMLGRHAAMNAQNADTTAALEAQVGAMLHAGKVLSSDDARKQIMPTLLEHNYFNMRRHANTVKAGDALPAGYSYVREYTTQNAHKFFTFDPAKTSVETRLRNFGRFYTTKTFKEAARDGKGNLLIVPRHDMNSLGIEGANTASMLMKMWSKPSHLWKMAVVGYSPKMVINNAVGNWLMYAMKQSGAHGARGVVDAIRYSKSEKAALDAVKSGSTTAKQYMNRSWMQRYFRDEVNPANTFMGSTLQKEGQLGKRSGFKQGLHPLVHKIADQPVRVAAIHSYLRGAPEVKTLMGKGMGFDKAADRALSKSRDLRDRAATHAQTIAGNYTRMTPKEQVVRQVIPFYAWDKHISKHAANLLSEHPGRVLGLESVGQQGSKNLQGKFGALPDYMLNELPIGVDHSTGRQKMIDLRGLNPYSSAGEIGASLLGNNTAGFDTLASQINPLASAIMGLLTQSTADAARGGGTVQAHGQGIAGLGLSTAAGAFGNIPELRLMQDALNGKQDTRTTKAGTVEPLLNERNIKDDLLNYLAGLPVKRVDMTHAQDIQRKNTGQKKKSALAQLLGG